MKSIALLIAIVLMFQFTELTLTKFLPLARTDFDVWMDYFITKDAVTDAMFFLFSLVAFWNTKGKAKAVSVFLVIVTGGSAIDKVIFNINQYLLSDFILIGLAAIVSLKAYERNGRFKDVDS